jgi:MFS family permease
MEQSREISDTSGFAGPLADAPGPLGSRDPRYSPGRSRHRRLRLFYFAVASIWGFVIGSTAVIGAAVLEQPGFRVGPIFALALGLAALVAAGGGLVAARVYRSRV